MKIAIQTLGCKVNQAESASFEGALRKHDFKIVTHSDNPDIFIINTCTVTAKSDYQSRQLIRKAVKSGAKVIATGCYAQLKPDELSSIKGISLILGNSSKNNLLDHLQDLIKSSGKPSILVHEPDSPIIAQPYYSTRSRAFLKIQDGCNFSCAYCAVPLARGRSRSLNPEDALTAAGELYLDGYGEVVLTGIHIGSYGLDLQPKSNLTDFVKMLTTSFPQMRIRLSSLEPMEFKEDLLSLIANRSICNHLHIPLQSGSDRILKTMNRCYTTDYFKGLIEKIVSSCPGISIGTDVIAGFPGENDNDFNDTVRLIEQLPFSYLHVFPYSRRPGTMASTSDDFVKNDIIKERVRILLKISANKKNIYSKSNLGKILDVIVEKKVVTGSYNMGISDNYLKLLIKGDVAVRGQRIKAKVISLTDSQLLAERVQ